MATKKLSLAQALTYKSRVIEEINRITQLIQRFNSVAVPEGVIPADCRQSIDVQEMMTKRHGLKEHLVALKIKLWEISQPIRRSILKLAELKDDVVFMSGLKTEDGIVSDADRYYNNVEKPLKFSAVVKRLDIELSVHNYKAAIDTIQAEIDEFNHTTKIEIEDVGI
jgi:hypothetical protein